MSEVAEGADGGRDSSGEEVVSNRKSFEVWEVFEEVEVAGEFVGGDVQHAEAREGGQFGRDFAGEVVIGEVEDFEFSAVNDLGRESVNEFVVREGEFFELAQASYSMGQNTVKVLRFENESCYSEHVGFLGGESSLAEYAIGVARRCCVKLTVDSEVFL